jgi:hypothetical protein
MKGDYLFENVRAASNDANGVSGGMGIWHCFGREYSIGPQDKQPYLVAGVPPETDPP